MGMEGRGHWRVDTWQGSGGTTLGLAVVHEPAKGMPLQRQSEVTGDSQAEKGKKMKGRSRKRELLREIEREKINVKSQMQS